jgi:hypothetical protein
MSSWNPRIWTLPQSPVRPGDRRDRPARDNAPSALLAIVGDEIEKGADVEGCELVHPLMVHLRPSDEFRGKLDASHQLALDGELFRTFPNCLARSLAFGRLLALRLFE